jgi:hypothetical protein
VVWIPPEGLGCMAFVRTWSVTYPPESLDAALRAQLVALFEDYLPGAIHAVRRDCKEGGIASVDNNLATSCCRMFQCLFLPSKGFVQEVDGKIQARSPPLATGPDKE